MSQPGEPGAGDHGDAAGAGEDIYEGIVRAHKELAIAAYVAKGEAPEGLNVFHYYGRWVVYRGPLPSARTVADVKREPDEYGCHLYELSGGHLRWLLADPCTFALEHGLAGQKMQEDEAERAAKAQRRKVKEQLLAEEAEEKRRGRRRR